MTIRHIALFRWAQGVTPEQIASVEEGLSRLPAAIPQLLSYSYGADLGLGAGNHDFAVVADLADDEAFRVYRDHPEHQAVLAVVTPLLADRAAVQFTLPS
ncbi:Dabb family protein [Marinactinospora thermotolerans]|uniref:Stress responsive A/B Barrel Domain n=1 Tax=Marinactinospora thermotolerans DSM 45154 TaxID=1122192 RepID=A0A1T4LFG6_9ACTN|nr:Dabb family protein [Marinactinospora thermotolerans]SJZ53455.1 Stress responsive A/B Barrel Domain [Marinactinospora thermotolerans DSM 45154]